MLPVAPPRFSGIAKPGGGLDGSFAGGFGAAGFGDGVFGLVAATGKAYLARLRVQRTTSAASRTQLVVNQVDRSAILL